MGSREEWYWSRRTWDEIQIYGYSNLFKQVWDRRCTLKLIEMVSPWGHTQLFRLFVPRSSHQDLNAALEMTSLHGYLDIVKMLILAGADSLDSALCYAAEGRHLLLIKYLLDSGANIHANEDGMDLLLYPFFNTKTSGLEQTIKYLLHQGADVHVMNESISIKSQFLPTTKILLRFGANSNGF